MKKILSLILTLFCVLSLVGCGRSMDDIIKNESSITGVVEEVYNNSGNVKKCAVGKHPKSEKLGSTGQAACCARIHSRYFTGGSPSGLRV